MVYGVSLGPGHPELITVQGLQTLQMADVIYYPGAIFGSGRKSSYALSIITQYRLNPLKLKGFFLEMDRTRQQAEQIYENTFCEIKKDYKNGLNVAIVSEGDLSTFSSFSYLLKKMKSAGLPLKLIPGISSYALLAAQGQIALCQQNDSVIILPAIQTADELKESIAGYDTVILMKIKSVKGVINEVLSAHDYTIRYGEYLGTDREYLASDWAEIKTREIPYFSVMTIQK